MAESFFDFYDGKIRLEVGRPGAGFYVELFEHASYSAMEGAVKAMAQISVSGNGQPAMRGDVSRSIILQILGHVFTWNITDEAGKVLPITEESIRRLPTVVVNQLRAKVEQLDAEPSPADRKRFPDQDGGGDPAGLEGAGVLPEVPAGDGDLPAAGAELGAVQTAPGP